MSIDKFHCWLLTMGALLCLVACDAQRHDGVVYIDGLTMGTTYSIQMHALPDQLDTAELQNRLEQLLAEINRQMSTYQPDSEISRFNQSQSTDWFPISAEFAGVAAAAQQISHLTEGAFDITVGPLVELWGFGTRITTQRPADAEVAGLMAGIGYGQLEWRTQPPGLRKRVSGLQIDLSAIAKGYGADVLADHLSGAGVDNYLVEIGGELRAAGVNPDGRPWQVGIQQPDAETPQAQQVLGLHDQGVATSGDYLNFYVQDGRRFSHIIDPRSGYPVKHQTASVTVVAATTMQADVWATALLVLGEDQGLQLAEAHSIAALFLVRKAGSGFETVISPAMQAVLD